MPGISFSYSFSENLKSHSKAVFGTLKHFGNYKCDEYLKESAFFLGISGYEEYPRHYYEDESVAILLEGCIYNVENDQLDAALCNLARLLSKQEFNTSQIEGWLLKTDGDFIVFIYHKKDKIVSIINDIYGRLPFYYYVDDKMILASREHDFILRQLPSLHFDRMGIALMLLFTFTIDKRTIWEKVNYLEGGTVLKINLNSHEKHEISRVCNVNFESLEKNKVEPSDIDELVKLFRNASIDRASSNNPNVIGLSGGLDSRAVAAAMDSFPLIGVTRLSVNQKESADARIAKLVANSLGKMKWNLIEAASPTGADLSALLKMKGGLNSLEMCFNLPFLNQVRNAYGAGIRYFTGDGGDRVKPHFMCRKKINSIQDLADYVIDRFQVSTLKQVSMLMNIPEHEIVQVVEQYLRDCPEKSFKHKYMHFQIYESAFKWVFEGEDRNRFYFWSVTPFYGTEFFLKLMRIPDEYKRNYRLYRDFLFKLSPILAGIDNHDWNLPITSLRLRYKLKMKELFHSMPSVVRNSIRKIVMPAPVLPSSEFVRCMKQLMASEEAKKIMADYFSISEINLLLENTDKQSNATFYMLFTLMMAIEAAFKDDVTLGCFAECDMI